MIDASPVRSETPDLRVVPLKFVGVTSSVAKVHGQGQTVTRTTTGTYKTVFADAPGTLITAVASLQATTPAGVKQYTVVRGTYDATNFALSFYIYDSSGNLVDLTALQWLDVIMCFTRAQYLPE